jgi:FkbM family methyltransferase
MREFSINKFSKELNEESLSERERTYKQSLELVQIENLNENSVVLDLGSNWGDVLKGLESCGCKVYAFEPHPFFYNYMKEEYGDNDNFIISDKAAWTKNEERKFYFKNSREAKNGGATLMSEKTNIIDPYLFDIVECFSISDFIKEIGHVDVLKIDVEGAEYEILYSILESGAHEKIRSIYVEDHERKMPSLRFAEMKNKVINGYTKIEKDLYWW